MFRKPPPSNLYDRYNQRLNRQAIPNFNQFVGEDGKKYSIEVSEKDYTILDEKDVVRFRFSFNEKNIPTSKPLYLGDISTGYPAAESRATFFNDFLDGHFSGDRQVLSRAYARDGTVHHAIVSEDLKSLFKRAVAALDELAGAEPPAPKGATFNPAANFG